MASRADPLDVVNDGEVLLDVSAQIGRVTLNRPGVANAISLSLARELMRAFHGCEDAPDLRAVIIAGSGPVFCGGGDLAAIRASEPRSSAYVRELLVYLHEVLQTIARIPVPVIAAVQGPAAGAGMALALSCDLVVAAASARLNMSYTKVGATPDGSSTWYLPRIVGMRRSLELALLNRDLSADEALSWGLVTEVVADVEVGNRAMALGEQLRDGASEAVGEAKRLVRCSFQHTLSEQLAIESAAICKAVGTPAAESLMDRFLAGKQVGKGGEQG